MKLSLIFVFVGSFSFYCRKRWERCFIRFKSQISKKRQQQVGRLNGPAVRFRDFLFHFHFYSSVARSWRDFQQISCFDSQKSSLWIYLSQEPPRELLVERGSGSYLHLANARAEIWNATCCCCCCCTNANCSCSASRKWQGFWFNDSFKEFPPFAVEFNYRTQANIFQFWP